MGCVNNKEAPSVSINTTRTIKVETDIETDIPVKWSVVHNPENHRTIVGYLRCSGHTYIDGWCSTSTREVIVKCSVTEILEMFVLVTDVRLEIEHANEVWLRTR